MNFRKIAVLALCMTLFACAAERMLIKTYEGDPLPPNKSALLKPTSGMVIKSINGKPVIEGSSGEFTAVRPGLANIDADISFKEGTHTLVLGYFANTSTTISTGTIRSRNNIVLPFNAVAGRRYVLTAEFNQQQTSWRPKIVDVTDNPQAWCTANQELSLWVKNKCE